MQEIEDLVAEIGRRTEQAAETGRRIAGHRVSVEIPGELGTVSVSGYGQLLDIVLHRENLWSTNESALGRLVVDVLGSAEQQAAEWREAESRRDRG